MDGGYRRRPFAAALPRNAALDLPRTKREPATMALMIQTLASGVAIFILAALAWRFGVGRHPAVLTDAHARALLADEFPGAAIGSIWLAADGRSALARSGGEALIVYSVGDGHVVRSAPWANIAAGEVIGTRVLVRLHDRSAPRAAFRIGPGAKWPPAQDA